MEIESKTIISTDGRILLYSTEDFYNRIINGTDCFICGAERNTKQFNDEHILPEWLLGKYKLHKKQITLTNSANFQYSRYTVSCCKDCNSELGKLIETPASKLLKLSYAEISQKIEEDQQNLFVLFRWLMLIFFKTHLKDTEFNWNLDSRKGTEKIGDTYDWQDMHHIHCMIRKHHTNAILHINTIGSIFILPAIQHPEFEPFDFIDNKIGQSIMIRLDGFCMICVLNDSCGSLNVYQDELAKITGPLTPFQLKEIFTHLVYINMHLKERPLFYSQFLENGEYHIHARTSDIVELIDEKERKITHGELIYNYFKHIIPKVENRETILNEIRNGKRQFLFDQNGVFLDYSKEIK